MGVVTARVYTLSDIPPNDPIADVTVRIFDETGASLITAGVTNASGYFQFDIDGDDPAINYEARCSKLGVSFLNPEMLAVYDPVPVGGTNNFNVYGTLLTMPVATDALFCRASGYFMDLGGRPVEGTMLRFINLFEPLILNGRGIISQVEVRTDSNGYAMVDLVRGGKYQVQVAGLQDERVIFTVPDRSSVNLLDMIFPIVGSVSFSPAGPWTVAVGDSLELTPTVTTTSYVTLEGTANGDVSYVAGDVAIAEIQVLEDTIRIVGVCPGSTTLEITRRDDSIRRFPETDITGSGIAITVT